MLETSRGALSFGSSVVTEEKESFGCYAGWEPNQGRNHPNICSRLVEEDRLNNLVVCGNHPVKHSFDFSESEISSQLYFYPRRIFLSLCLNLRRSWKISSASSSSSSSSNSSIMESSLKLSPASSLRSSSSSSSSVTTTVTPNATLIHPSSSWGEMCWKKSNSCSVVEKVRGATSGGRVKRSGSGMRRLSRLVPLVCFYLLMLVDSSWACGPGRGAGRRRVPRKLTPLVYKQHVPNVPENTLSASGLHEGKINRDHPRFKALVPNYNMDIIFRDDEGTGADRLMTQRCKEKLNTLAISVMNQWPGVRLRVIEGWDEGAHHGSSSLHYEGRAVDITTSDKDRSKYGMLARLAVEAGFDWVYYESRAHIHCSVKSDSSQAARTGGCFSENATVVTPEGQKKITDVRPGDSILSVNSKGEQVFSEVMMFLDRNETETREFYHLTTSGGTSLSLTPSHLIYKIDRITGDELSRSGKAMPSSEDLLATAGISFAKLIEAGDWLLLAGKDGLVMEKLVRMESVVSTGVYAPLTKEGNVVIDGVLSSCYAVINDQSLAHWAFAPVRFLVNVYEGVTHGWKQLSRFLTFRPPISPPVVPLPSLSSSQLSQVEEVKDNGIGERWKEELEASSSKSSPPNSQIIKSRNIIRLNQLNFNQAKSRSSSSSSSSNNNNNNNSYQQGVHWYASMLYSTSKYFIPADLLYE